MEFKKKHFLYDFYEAKLGYPEVTLARVAGHSEVVFHLPELMR